MSPTATQTLSTQKYVCACVCCVCVCARVRVILCWNIHKCHVWYPHSSLACTHVFCALFVLLCARISIYIYKYIYICYIYIHTNVCVCVSASQINSVALEPKIYYQIKFLTEFIALSLAKHSSFASRQHQKYSTSRQHSSNKPTNQPTEPN